MEMFTMTTVEVSLLLLVVFLAIIAVYISSNPRPPTTSGPELLNEGEKEGGGDLSLSQGVVRMEPHTTKDPAKENPASTQTRCGGTTHTPRVVPGSSMQL